MKKIYFPMMVAMIIVTSGLSKAKAATYEPAKAKAEVMKTVEEINAAMKAGDAKTVISYYAEDGLFCGTDPTEFWDKAAFAKQITEMLADKTKPMNMTMDKREIRVAKDGMSAIVVGQFTTDWSKPIMVRNTRHFVKVNGKWMVDFMSVALIPKNDDLPKITAAVK